MKSVFFLLIGVGLFSILSCQNTPKAVGYDANKNVTVEAQSDTKTVELSYELAKNYFVKNTFKKLDSVKIENLEKFNQVFGMATTMGKDGKPTEIDFAKKFVIAVIKPETNIATKITPVSLTKDTAGALTLTYKSLLGEKQSYTMVPFFALIVDKAESGSITLKEIQ